MQEQTDLHDFSQNLIQRILNKDISPVKFYNFFTNGEEWIFLRFYNPRGKFSENFKKGFYELS